MRPNFFLATVLQQSIGMPNSMSDKFFHKRKQRIIQTSTTGKAASDDMVCLWSKGCVLLVGKLKFMGIKKFDLDRLFCPMMASRKCGLTNPSACRRSCPRADRSAMASEGKTGEQRSRSCCSSDVGADGAGQAERANQGSGARS